MTMQVADLPACTTQCHNAPTQEGGKPLSTSTSRQATANNHRVGGEISRAWLKIGTSPSSVQHRTIRGASRLIADYVTRGSSGGPNKGQQSSKNPKVKPQKTLGVQVCSQAPCSDSLFAAVQGHVGSASTSRAEPTAGALSSSKDSDICGGIEECCIEAIWVDLDGLPGHFSRGPSCPRTGSHNPRKEPLTCGTSCCNIPETSRLCLLNTANEGSTCFTWPPSIPQCAGIERRSKREKPDRINSPRQGLTKSQVKLTASPSGPRSDRARSLDPINAPLSEGVRSLKEIKHRTSNK